MRSKADPRHTSRKLALSSIFCWLFTEPTNDECLLLSQETLETEGVEYDKDLVEYIVEGVKQHLTEIDTIIAESAPDWPIDKIAKVDLVILRIAVFETVFGKKTPTRVAIDEAVELSKEFGNDTSHKFVNGVLGTVDEKNMTDYLTKIKKVIQETGHDPKDVQETSYFEDDLNIGEMELLEILSELEEIYHVELVDEQGNIETVQDLVELIAEQAD